MAHGLSTLRIDSGGYGIHLTTYLTWHKTGEITLRTNVINLEKFNLHGLWIQALAIGKYSLTKRTYAVVIFIIALILLYSAGSRPLQVWINFKTAISHSNTGTIISLIEVTFILLLWFANIVIGWHNSLNKPVVSYSKVKTKSVGTLKIGVLKITTQSLTLEVFPL
jgi:hypothetical protein